MKALKDWANLDVDTLCWDVMENRNFPLLEAAAKPRKGSIEVLVNELCTYGCIYRNHCYDLSSHSSSRLPYGRYPFAWCIQQRNMHPWEWIASRFVLPEHLDYYASLGVDAFKISGRTSSWKALLPVVEYYMKRESPDNLLDLWAHVNPLVGDIHRPEKELYISTTQLKKTSWLHSFRTAECSISCQQTCFRCNRLFDQIGVWQNQPNVSSGANVE